MCVLLRTCIRAHEYTHGTVITLNTIHLRGRVRHGETELGRHEGGEGGVRGGVGVAGEGVVEGVGGEEGTGARPGRGGGGCGG